MKIVKFSTFETINDVVNFEGQSRYANDTVYITRKFLFAFLNAFNIDNLDEIKEFFNGNLEALPRLKSDLVSKYRYPKDRLKNLKAVEEARGIAGIPHDLIERVIDHFQFSNRTYRPLLRFVHQHGGLKTVLERLSLKGGYLRQAQQKMIAQVSEDKEKHGGVLTPSFTEIYARFYGFEYGEKNTASITYNWVYKKLGNKTADKIHECNPTINDDTWRRRDLNHEHTNGDVFEKIKQRFAMWGENMRTAQKYAEENGLNRQEKFKHFRKLMNLKEFRVNGLTFPNNNYVPQADEAEAEKLMEAAREKRFSDEFISAPLLKAA